MIVWSHEIPSAKSYLYPPCKFAGSWFWTPTTSSYGDESCSSSDKHAYRSNCNSHCLQLNWKSDDLDTVIEIYRTEYKIFGNIYSMHIINHIVTLPFSTCKIEGISIILKTNVIFMINCLYNIYMYYGPSTSCGSGVTEMSARHSYEFVAHLCYPGTWATVRKSKTV